MTFNNFKKYNRTNKIKQKSLTNKWDKCKLQLKSIFL